MRKCRHVVEDVKDFKPLQVTAEEVDGSFDRMLRRFVRRTRDDGILDEVRDRNRGFRKPSEQKRRSVKRAPR